MAERELSDVFERVARGERRATAITSGLLLVVAAGAFALVWTSAQRYERLQQAIDAANRDLGAARMDLDQTRAETETLLQDRDRLTAERDAKLAEVETLEAKSAQLAADIALKARMQAAPVPAPQRVAAEKRVREFAADYAAKPKTAAPARPLSAVVKPQAGAKPVRKMSDGTQLYAFSLWLKVPEERKGEILKVVYQFDHPTFRVKEQTSTDPGEGFRVEYRGWGALTNVDITIHSRQGKEPPLKFNMLEALGWAGAKKTSPR